MSSDPKMSEAALSQRDMNLSANDLSPPNLNGTEVFGQKISDLIITMKEDIEAKNKLICSLKDTKDAMSGAISDMKHSKRKDSLKSSILLIVLIVVTAAFAIFAYVTTAELNQKNQIIQKYENTQNRSSSSEPSTPELPIHT